MNTHLFGQKILFGREIRWLIHRQILVPVQIAGEIDEVGAANVFGVKRKTIEV